MHACILRFHEGASWARRRGLGTLELYALRDAREHEELDRSKDVRRI